MTPCILKVKWPLNTFITFETPTTIHHLSNLLRSSSQSLKKNAFSRVVDSFLWHRSKTLGAALQDFSIKRKPVALHSTYNWKPTDGGKTWSLTLVTFWNPKAIHHLSNSLISLSQSKAFENKNMLFHEFCTRFYGNGHTLGALLSTRFQHGMQTCCTAQHLHVTTTHVTFTDGGKLDT